MVDNVADVCNEAAYLLERDGWCQEVLMDDQGRRCVVEAVYASSTRGYDEVLRGIETHLNIPYGEIVNWNNDPSRTVVEVVAALRGTAKEHACPQ